MCGKWQDCMRQAGALVWLPYSLSLLKMKTKFHNSKLESMEKDPNEWILNLEGLKVHMFRLKGRMSEEDSMIHVLNNLSEEYDVLPNGLKNHFMVSGNDALTMDMICEKLNYWYKKINSKKEEKSLQQTV